jgi:hypothetical protein
MNSIVVFVATSLILVVAVVAIAIPNVVHANPPHQWCQNVAPGDCFPTKTLCKQSLLVGSKVTCVKSK